MKKRLTNSQKQCLCIIAILLITIILSIVLGQPHESDVYASQFNTSYDHTLKSPPDMNFTKVKVKDNNYTAYGGAILFNTYNVSKWYQYENCILIITDQNKCIYSSTDNIILY